MVICLSQLPVQTLNKWIWTFLINDQTNTNSTVFLYRILLSATKWIVMHCKYCQVRVMTFVIFTNYTYSPCDLNKTFFNLGELAWTLLLHIFQETIEWSSIYWEIVHATKTTCIKPSDGKKQDHLCILMATRLRVTLLGTVLSTCSMRHMADMEVGVVHPIHRHSETFAILLIAGLMNYPRLRANI